MTEQLTKVPFFRSLYVRLALGFLLVLISIGGVQLYFARNEFIRLLDRINQQVYWELASELANELQPQLVSRFSRERAENLLHQSGIFVPFAEIYLLDESGTIVAAYPNHRGYSVERIDITPVRSALSIATPETPLYGENPVLPEQKKVFSAAPLSLGGAPGYVYVILNGFIMEELYRSSGGFFITRSLVGGFVVISIVAALLSILLFRYLTRRFRNLTATVLDFEQERFSVRADAATPDEVGILARTLNSMADSLMASREQIKAQEMVRRELVASIAHDIRTPLAAVLSHLERALKLGGERIPEDVRTAITNARQSAFFQNGLIAELFELSKLDALERAPDLDFITARSVAEMVTQSLSGIASERGISLVLDEVSGGSEPAVIEADQKLLIRALTNLIDNALKFTPQGGTVTLELHADGSSVRFAVADTGPGIPEADRERIFERFAQVRPDDRGAGLGLTIAKRIIELHGGKLQLDASDRGCRFGFVLARAAEG